MMHSFPNPFPFLFVYLWCNFPVISLSLTPLMMEIQLFVLYLLTTLLVWDHMIIYLCFVRGWSMICCCRWGVFRRGNRWRFFFVGFLFVLVRWCFVFSFVFVRLVFVPFLDNNLFDRCLCGFCLIVELFAIVHENCHCLLLLSSRIIQIFCLMLF